MYGSYDLVVWEGAESDFRLQSVSKTFNHDFICFVTSTFNQNVSKSKIKNTIAYATKSV